MGPFVVSFLIQPSPISYLELIMECLNDKRTELPIYSLGGSLVPYICRAEGVSEELVPHGLCFVVPWLPSWSRARWAPGTVSPGTAELFPWIFGVISALVNHSGFKGASGDDSPCAVSTGRVTMPLVWWECPVGSRRS